MAWKSGGVAGSGWGLGGGAVFLLFCVGIGMGLWVCWKCCWGGVVCWGFWFLGVWLAVVVFGDVRLGVFCVVVRVVIGVLIFISFGNLAGVFLSGCCVGGVVFLGSVGFFWWFVFVFAAQRGKSGTRYAFSRPPRRVELSLHSFFFPSLENDLALRPFGFENGSNIALARPPACVSFLLSRHARGKGFSPPRPFSVRISVSDDPRSRFTMLPKVEAHRSSLSFFSALCARF